MFFPLCVCKNPVVLTKACMRKKSSQSLHAPHGTQTYVIDSGTEKCIS